HVVAVGSDAGRKPGNTAEAPNMAWMWYAPNGGTGAPRAWYVGARRSLPTTALDIMDSEGCPRPPCCFAQCLTLTALVCGGAAASRGQVPPGEGASGDPCAPQGSGG